MKRALLIGCGGSGKSTLAKRLADRTGLPLIHLDAFYWHPGWVETPKPEWEARVTALVSQDAWVMDGNYGGTLDIRLNAADTIIFMDLPRRTCVWRVLRRWWQHRGRSRPDLGDGCPEQLSWEFLRWVWSYRRDRRPTVLEKLRGLDPEKRVVILRANADVERFLESSVGATA
jgi:adenylate kinase family enzyme